MSKGVLSIDQMLEGAELAAKNARDLARGATLLRKARIRGAATALAITSLEESAKSLALVTVAGFQSKGNAIDWPAFWKWFEDHDGKQGLALGFDVSFHGEAAADLLYEAIRYGRLEQRRQDALYLDYKKPSWLEPSRIKKELTADLIDAASEIARGLNGMFRRGTPETWEAELASDEEDEDDRGFVAQLEANVREALEAFENRMKNDPDLRPT